MRSVQEEQVIQKFPNLCPYCDQPVSYDQFDLKIGDNFIRCPSCKEVYIKVVFDSLEANKTAIRSKKSKKVRRKNKRHPHSPLSKGK